MIVLLNTVLYHSYKALGQTNFKNNWEYNIPKTKNITKLNIIMKIVYKKSLYKHPSLNFHKSNIIIFDYISYKFICL